MTKYRYAYGSDQSIVDVHQLTPNSRYKFTPYICFGCGGELIPNLGKIKIKHFSHKASSSCSRETYLHKLSKDTFFRTYKKCLDNNKSFVLNSTFPAICNHYKNVVGESCNINKSIDVDLTKHFKMIALEKEYSGFVPDILLSSEDRSEVLFIELVVTHKCEDNKVNLGKRIIEICINDESDIEDILSKKLYESSKNIKTYNFKKKNISGDICKGECKNLANLFVIYESQKSILLELPPSEAIKGPTRGRVRHSEIIGYSPTDEEDITRRYKDKVREAHFNKIPIKNCFICRYHGIDGIENAIFCKFRKESVSSNEAVNCDYYKVFRNIKECQDADKINEEYLRKNESKFLARAFMRFFSPDFPY